MYEQTKKPPAVPSRRDQEIFKRVEIHCERQCVVAEDLKITPSRVSQIVGRVRRWLASGAEGETETMSALERRRLERSLAQARHQAIYELVMREAARQENQPHHKTVRTRVEDGEEKSVVTTLRDQRLNVQLLKAAQRSAIELERLAEREQIPEPVAEPTAEDHYEEVASMLFGLHLDAQRADRVPRAHDVHLKRQIENLLASFLGRQPKPETVAEKIRRVIERRESAADEGRPAADGSSMTDPTSVTESNPPVHCASLMHPTSADSAQHEHATLAPDSAACVTPPLAATAAPPVTSATAPAASEQPKPAAAARKKTEILRPPPPGGVMFGRPTPPAEREEIDSLSADKDDQPPIVLHAWPPSCPIRVSAPCS